MSEDVRLSFGIPISLAVRSDVGRVRANNEDAYGMFWRDDGALLVAVCDGMGGHEAEEVASQLAVESLHAHFATGRGPAQARLHQALIAANQAIVAEGRQAGKRGMGTTAIVAEIQGRQVYVGLVGDSRLYHVRRGHVVERTVDHTRVQSLLERGVITQSDAREHPEAGMLTRALGHAKMSNGKPLEPEVFAEPLQLQDGDALVLSSDGLHDLADDWEIAATIAGELPDASAQALIDLALERGGHDNVTVAVVCVGERSLPYDPSFQPDARPEPRAPSPTAPPVPVGEVDAPSVAPAASVVNAPSTYREDPPASDAKWIIVAALVGAALLVMAAGLIGVAMMLAYG